MIWSLFFFLFLCCNLKSFSALSSFLILEVDSILMLSVMPLVFLLISWFIYSRFGALESSVYVFTFFVLLLLVSLCFLVSSPFNFLVFLESTVVPMVMLIFYLSKDSDKVVSVFFMLLINLFGSLPFMVFCSSCDGAVGPACWGLINFDSWLIWFGFVLILASKLPFIFLHFWLTKAHVSSSGACSMVLASLMLKLGSFGLFKFFAKFLLNSHKSFSLVVSMGVFSVLIFSIIMIRFFDLKYLVACSSIVHMSLIFPFLLMGGGLGVAGSLLMMVGHGLVSPMLFMMVSFLYELSHNRSLDFNKSVESVAKTTGLFIFIYVFLNMGVPPFVTFFSELFFVGQLISFSLSAFSISWLGMLLSIIFVMIICSKVLFGKKFMKPTSVDPDKIMIINMSFMGFLAALVYLS